MCCPFVPPYQSISRPRLDNAICYGCKVRGAPSWWDCGWAISCIYGDPHFAGPNCAETQKGYPPGDMIRADSPQIEWVREWLFNQRIGFFALAIAVAGVGNFSPPFFPMAPAPCSFSRAVLDRHPPHTSFITECIVARDSGRATTRRWGWIPFPWGPPSPPPCLRTGGEDGLRFPGFSRPHRRNGHRRPGYSCPHLSWLLKGRDGTRWY